MSGICRDEGSQGGSWQVEISVSENHWIEGWGRSCLLFRNFDLNKSTNSLSLYVLPQRYIIWKYYIFKESILDVYKAEWEKVIMAAQEYPQPWIIHVCFLISSRQEAIHVISCRKDEQNIGWAIYHCLRAAGLVTSQGPSIRWHRPEPRTLGVEARGWAAQGHPLLQTKFKTSQGYIKPHAQNQTEKWALRGAWVTTIEYRKTIWAPKFRAEQNKEKERLKRRREVGRRQTGKEKNTKPKKSSIYSYS